MTLASSVPPCKNRTRDFCGSCCFYLASNQGTNISTGHCSRRVSAESRLIRKAEYHLFVFEMEMFLIWHRSERGPILWEILPTLRWPPQKVWHCVRAVPIFSVARWGRASLLYLTEPTTERRKARNCLQPGVHPHYREVRLFCHYVFIVILKQTAVRRKKIENGGKRSRHGNKEETKRRSYFWWKIICYPPA